MFLNSRLGLVFLTVFNAKLCFFCLSKNPTTAKPNQVVFAFYKQKPQGRILWLASILSVSCIFASTAFHFKWAAAPKPFLHSMLRLTPFLSATVARLLANRTNIYFPPYQHKANFVTLPSLFRKVYGKSFSRLSIAPQLFSPFTANIGSELTPVPMYDW